MRFTECLSMIFIGLLLLEVYAKNNEQHTRRPLRRTPTTFYSSHNIGPRYGLVSNNSLLHQERNGRRRLFGEQIKSFLNPLDNVLFNQDTPVYSVRSTGIDSNPEIEEYPNIFRHILTNLFDDIVHASVEEINKNKDINPSNNNFQRPIPRQLLRPTRYRRKPSKNSIEPNTELKRELRRAPQLNSRSVANDIRRYNALGMNRQNSPLQTSQPNLKIPDTIYIETLVIVDYSLYKKFHRSVWELVTYLIGFWNGVDIRFQGLRRPNFRLNIAGILIAEDKNALSYIARNFYGLQTLHVSKAINDKKKWLFKQKAQLPFTSYDIAVTMTALKLRSTNFEPKGYQSEIKGLGSIQGACLTNEMSGEVHKTAIFNDEGSFEAIMAAAHEIGHLLGASHDKSRSEMPNKCDGNSGFIMAPILIHKITSWKWSKCSKKNFKDFLKAGNGTCLYNKPKTVAVLPRILPGKLQNADEQCKAIGYNRAVLNHHICIHLICVQKNDSLVQYHTDHGAADGTPCDFGKICVRGMCKEERSMGY